MKNKCTNCPVCCEYEFEYPDDYDICPVCGWENDGVQRDDPTYWGGANNLSVNESKIVYNLLNHNEKSKWVLKLLDEYKKRNRDIHEKYRNIDHRTTKGEECKKAFGYLMIDLSSI